MSGFPLRPGQCGDRAGADAHRSILWVHAL